MSYVQSKTQIYSVDYDTTVRKSEKLTFDKMKLEIICIYVFFSSSLSCGPLITRLRERIQRNPEVEPDLHSHPRLPAIIPAHLRHDHIQ